MKAEPTRLIPLKPMENVELFIVNKHVQHLQALALQQAA